MRPPRLSPRTQPRSAARSKTEDKREAPNPSLSALYIGGSDCLQTDRFLPRGDLVAPVASDKSDYMRLRPVVPPGPPVSIISVLRRCAPAPPKEADPNRVSLFFGGRGGIRTRSSTTVPSSEQPRDRRSP